MFFLFLVFVFHDLALMFEHLAIPDETCARVNFSNKVGFGRLMSGMTLFFIANNRWRPLRDAHQAYATTLLAQVEIARAAIDRRENNGCDD
jgi:hypothetical protein